MEDRPEQSRLPAALCAWDEGGVLHSARFDDIYFSRDGGLDEKRHVFLDGCGLPDAWTEAGTDAPLVTVAELGFGTGLNFLLTWEAWRKRGAGKAPLHYLAVEGFPLSRAEMRDVCARWTALQPLSDALARAYPHPQRGFQRIHLSAGDDTPEVVLTLMFGDAAPMLHALEARVDAWYLDGFAPDRNPAMWTPEVMAEVARLSHDGDRPTRLAADTAASAVQQNLTAVGFELARTAGAGSAHDGLRGVYRGTGSAARPALAPWFARPARTTPGHAAIVGAGIAGTTAAQALRRRGWEVTLIDRHPRPAMETSGNPCGVLMPRLTADAGIEGRLHAAAWRYALQMLDGFDAAEIAYRKCGVLQIAETEADAARLAAIAADGLLPQEFVTRCTPEDATRIAGVPITRPALFFPHGGTIAPAQWCRALARAIPFRHAEIAGWQRVGESMHLIDGDGRTAVTADVIVFATALDAARLFPHLALSSRRGQLTCAPPTPASARLRTVLAAEATVTPATDGHHVIGATFDWTKDTAPVQPVRDEDHARNLAALALLAPGLGDGIDAAHLTGRAALRCMTPDHLPISGPVPDAAAYARDYPHLHHGQHWSRYPVARYAPGVFALTGLGARGLVTAPLAAEILASLIGGEPWPLERDLVTALHPARSLVRALRRRPS